MGVILYPVKVNMSSITPITSRLSGFKQSLQKIHVMRSEFYLYPFLHQTSLQGRIFLRYVF
jgi:hypothetical protein